MKRCKRFAAAGVTLIIVSVLAGCGTTQTNTSASPVTAAKKDTLNTNSDKVHNSVIQNEVVGTASAVPSYVAWNGYAYEEKGFIDQVGSKIGVATNPKAKVVYEVPGKDPNHMIAIEVDSSQGKYVSAIRQQLNTQGAQIPEDWMEFTGSKIRQTIQPGEQINVSGKVFFRALYGQSIQVMVRRYGYGKNATLQYFKVSDTGAFEGTIEIPKQLAGQPGKTRYNLSLWVPNTTSTVDLVLTLK